VQKQPCRSNSTEAASGHWAEHPPSPRQHRRGNQQGSLQRQLGGCRGATYRALWFITHSLPVSLLGIGEGGAQVRAA